MLANLPKGTFERDYSLERPWLTRRASIAEILALTAY